MTHAYTYTNITCVWMKNHPESQKRIMDTHIQIVYSYVNIFVHIFEYVWVCTFYVRLFTYVNTNMITKWISQVQMYSDTYNIYTVCICGIYINMYVRT